MPRRHGKITRGNTGNIGAVVGTTATLQADNGIDTGVSLHHLAAAEVFGWNGIGTTVDEGAGVVGASTFGGVAHLHVIQNSLYQAVVIKVQHSSDNSVWVDLATHPNVGAATKLA